MRRPKLSLPESEIVALQHYLRKRAREVLAAQKAGQPGDDVRHGVEGQ